MWKGVKISSIFLLEYWLQTQIPIDNSDASIFRSIGRSVDRERERERERERAWDTCILFIFVEIPAEISKHKFKSWRTDDWQRVVQLVVYTTPTCEKNFVIQTHWNLSSIYNKVYSLILANKIDSHREYFRALYLQSGVTKWYIEVHVEYLFHRGS